MRTHAISGLQCSEQRASIVHIEHSSTISRHKYLSQILATLGISLGPFAAGLSKGYSSPAIASLQDQQSITSSGHSMRLESLSSNLSSIHAVVTKQNIFTLSNQQASWVASLSLLGALFGALFGGLAMKFGRKNVLLATSIPFSVSWVLTVLAINVQMMYITSFIGGFCCAIILMVSQVYISEISDPSIRGCLSALLKIFGHVGVLVSYVVGAYLDWRQLAMVISVAPIALFFTTLYLPETPSFYILSGRDDEAAKSLRWLRGSHEINNELITIKMNVAKNRPAAGAIRDMLTKLRHPIAITCGLVFFQRFCGANAFNFYAVPIFRQTFGGMNPHGGAIAIAVVQLLAALLSSMLVDSIGRLPLLITGTAFMSVALAAFGSYAYFEMANEEDRQYYMNKHELTLLYDWTPLMCALVFQVAFSLGVGPIAWLLVGELFPLEYRGLGSALAMSFSYGCAFVGVKTFIDFKDALGLHGAFWLYSAMAIVGLCFVVCFVPETKGTDLQEMDRTSRIPLHEKILPV